MSRPMIAVSIARANASLPWAWVLSSSHVYVLSIGSMKSSSCELEEELEEELEDAEELTRVALTWSPQGFGFGFGFGLVLVLVGGLALGTGCALTCRASLK